MTALSLKTHMLQYVQLRTWLMGFSLGGFIAGSKDKIQLSCNLMWLSFWSELLELHWFEGNPKLVSCDQGDSRLVCSQRAGKVEQHRKAASVVWFWWQSETILSLWWDYSTFHTNPAGSRMLLIEWREFAVDYCFVCNGQFVLNFQNLGRKSMNSQVFS